MKHYIIFSLLAFIGSTQAMNLALVRALQSDDLQKFKAEYAKDPAGKNLPLSKTFLFYIHGPTIGQFLLDEGIDINATDSLGDTALMDVAMVANLAGVQFLVTKGANLSHVNKQGKTVLDLMRIAKALNDDKLGQMPNNSTAQKIAKKTTDVLNYLEDTIKKGSAASAAPQGPAKQEVLIDSRRMPAIELLIALQNDNLELFKREHKRSPRPVLEYLFYISGPNIGQFIMQQDPSNVQKYLNGTDELGNTPLMNAILTGSLPAVEFLVEKGASLTSVNKKGESILDVARNNHKHEIAVLELARKTNPAAVEVSQKDANKSAAVLDYIEAKTKKAQGAGPGAGAPGGPEFAATKKRTLENRKSA